MRSPLVGVSCIVVQPESVVARERSPIVSHPPFCPLFMMSTDHSRPEPLFTRVDISTVMLCRSDYIEVTSRRYCLSDCYRAHSGVRHEHNICIQSASGLDSREIPLCRQRPTAVAVTWRRYRLNDLHRPWTTIVDIRSICVSPIRCCV